MRTSPPFLTATDKPLKNEIKTIHQLGGSGISDAAVVNFRNGPVPALAAAFGNPKRFSKIQRRWIAILAEAIR
jgi:hypothetical protein